MWRSNSGLVLLYHRIAGLRFDPQLLAVTPDHFAQHLEALREYGCPMSLGEMNAALRDRRLPHRAIAVTFDDGYGDNLDCGVPLLARSKRLPQSSSPRPLWVAIVSSGGTTSNDCCCSRDGCPKRFAFESARRSTSGASATRACTARRLRASCGLERRDRTRPVAPPHRISLAVPAVARRLRRGANGSAG